MYNTYCLTHCRRKWEKSRRSLRQISPVSSSLAAVDPTSPALAPARTPASVPLPALTAALHPSALMAAVPPHAQPAEASGCLHAALAYELVEGALRDYPWCPPPVITAKQVRQVGQVVVVYAVVETLLLRPCIFFGVCCAGAWLVSKVAPPAMLADLERVIAANDWTRGWGGALVWWLNVGLALLAEGAWQVDKAVTAVYGNEGGPLLGASGLAARVRVPVPLAKRVEEYLFLPWASHLTTRGRLAYLGREVVSRAFVATVFVLLFQAVAGVGGWFLSVGRVAATAFMVLTVYGAYLGSLVGSMAIQELVPLPLPTGGGAAERGE